MKIKNLFEEKKTPVISFEVFPPNEKFTLDSLYETIEELSKLSPDFISVTYGAGGSTRSRTLEIATHIQKHYSIPTLAHLTCIGATTQEINSLYCDLSKNGIQNILALRGDMPHEMSQETLDNSDFGYASDLVEHIRSQDKECTIAGAFYPEGHKENNDLMDLLHLKHKVEAGSDFLISQIFFDNDIYMDYVEKMHKIGINLPIMAGIMPIVDAKQIKRICSLCHCSLPPKVERMLERFSESPSALKEAGISYAADQIIDLISRGVSGIHLYTMNKVDVTKEILRRIEHIRASEKNLSGVEGEV
ncbi:MAG: methylenetetrahydrofolate reductase [NAD(P)H] [Fusobacteria bacterium]|nr:methylenetetrahydrofolate reductase [NAD(P)H] [Fusobacteriota bacterium]